MTVLPEGQDATIDIYIDRPYTERGGIKIGTLALKASMPKTKTSITADVSSLSSYRGKHALFFVIHTAKKGRSACEIHDFAFSNK